MAGNLDVSETASSLVHKALQSGEWKKVQDSNGRECYFNATTRETTRDLRVLLLQRYDWAQSGGIGAAATGGKASGTGGRQPDPQIPEGESVDRIKRLEEELAAARRAVDMYEREVTELRLRLFGAPLRPESGSTVTSKPPDIQQGGDPAAATAAAALTEQLAAARRLNALLLERVTVDRQRQRLCAGCLENVTLSAVPVDRASLLASENIDFPKSLAPFSRQPDPVMIRAMRPHDGDGYSVDAPPPSIGYLPKTFKPTEPSLKTLRPWEPEDAPTSHAPLRHLPFSPAPVLRQQQQQHAAGASPVPTQNVEFLKTASGSDGMRAFYSPDAMRSPSHIALLQQHRAAQISGGFSAESDPQRRRIAGGIPTKLYDGYVHGGAVP